jgi:adhesin/invasin
MRFKSLRHVWLIAVISAGAACHDPNSYSVQGPSNPNGTPIDKILAVAAFPPSVPADGLSRTRITASIDPRSTTRRMTFETSLGLLISGTKTSQTEGGKLVLTADDAGTASVDLRSDAVVGAARVTVTIGDVVRTIEVPFSQVSADGLFTFAAANASLPADGYSMTELTATLKLSGDLRQAVKFTTSLGTLVTSTSDTTTRTETTVTATAEGNARIFLRSENTVGTATVKAELNGFSREVSVNFTSVVPSDVIVLTATPNPVAADGLKGTGTRLTATISPSIPQRLRAVVFTTSAGQFTTDLVNSDTKKAQVTADSSNVATVQLVSDVPVTANVTATVAGVSGRVNVEFTRALPDLVSVEAAPVTVSKTGSDSTMITVFLVRTVGQVSTNALVTYSAADSTGTGIGTFTDVTLATVDTTDTSANPRLKATAKFNPDDTAATGAATITANVGGVTGKVIVQLTP